MNRQAPEAEGLGWDFFDVLEFGEQVVWQNYRREYPDESEEQIRRRVDEWFLERPGAELGDAGPAPFFRPRRAP